ncbi:hypothetical protein RN001_011546 [Aquatica leii]|uniref:Uncharacterized protein n=1 Tax=Aquatica leii TaxID=1421715 RepID=A0AAN7P1N4_9COLE|nr:hypothetical protein RN001_011546 [Aquatica leii]
MSTTSPEQIIQFNDFYLEEILAETNSENFDTLKEKILEIIRKKMEIQLGENEIDFISRLGERKENRNRPVKTGYTAILKKWEIMRNTKKLAGTQIGLNDDLDKQTREEKKQLISHMKNARKKV